MPSQPAGTWYCTECGSLNSSWFDLCPVCNRGTGLDSPRSIQGDSIFSDASSITSGTSLGSLAPYGGHDFVLQEIIDLLLNDNVTNRLLSKAIQNGIIIERVERKLRRLLKRLGADLQAESKTVEQRRIAKFLALKSRLAALAVVKNVVEFEYRLKTPSGTKMGDPAKAVESSSEEDTEPETNEFVQETEENNLVRAKEFIIGSSGFAAMKQNLWHSVFPTLNSKILDYVEMAAEKLAGAIKDNWTNEGQVLATELFDTNLASTRVCKDIQVSTVDMVKHKVEALTGGTWNWWPLKSPLPCLGDDYTYIRWTCCGEDRLVKAPIALTDQIEQWKKELPQRMVAPPKSGAPLSLLRVPEQQIGNQKIISQRDANQPDSTSPQETNVVQGNTDLTTSHSQSASGWVLLIVQSRDDYKLAQINMSGCTADSFFIQLRSEYLRLRGFKARCLSVWCYSHCDFYKSCIWDEDAVVPLKRNQYPDPSDLEYDYEPKPILDMPPITKHEFRKRYESCHRIRLHFRCYKQCPCAKAKAKAHNRNIIDLLPKKTTQLDMNTDQRITFWGLYARQEISFFRILLYNAICISPLIWFFFMWLFAWAHDGDQQNASVPLMTMLSLLSIFWTTFIASLFQKSDGDVA